MAIDVLYRQPVGEEEMTLDEWKITIDKALTEHPEHGPLEVVGIGINPVSSNFTGERFRLDLGFDVNGFCVDGNEGHPPGILYAAGIYVARVNTAAEAMKGNIRGYLKGQDISCKFGLLPDEMFSKELGL